MGLRINTNINAVSSLRQLAITDRAQTRSLERLASGLRLNRGSDGPGDLVISEKLRAQIAALKQNGENSQNAANLISVADNALGKVSDLLIEIQDSIEFALNTGGSTPEQIAAQQDAVDQAIGAIDRIANTTRYAGRNLLNGEASYKLSTGVDRASGAVASGAGVTNLTFRSVNFIGDQTERTLELQLEDRPQRAEIILSTVSAIPTVSGGTTVIRITGARGTADITLFSSASGIDIADAVNSVSIVTGVFAQDDSNETGGGDVVLRSEDFGSDAFISITAVDGDLDVGGFSIRNASGGLSAVSGDNAAAAFTSLVSAGVVSDRGGNAKVTFEGNEYTGKGLDFSINSPTANFSFTLNADLYHPHNVAAITDLPSATSVTGSTISFDVSRTGLEFQLRELARSTDRLSIGIQGANTSVLGIEVTRDVIAEANELHANLSATSIDIVSTDERPIFKGGFLSSLMTGQGNDLTQNAQNALTIVNAAIDQVTSARGFLGAAVGFNIEPNIESVDVAVENLSASLSAIRDLDFAEETANFARTQILFQSGIASLAASRLIPQSVLQLLG